MDFTGVTVDSASALAAAMIVVGGYAAVWGIKLVIGVFKK